MHAGGELISSRHGNNGAGSPGHKIGVFELHSYQERPQLIVYKGLPPQSCAAPPLARFYGAGGLTGGDKSGCGAGSPIASCSQCAGPARCVDTVESLPRVARDTP
jgi:hypothetical protein